MHRPPLPLAILALLGACITDARYDSDGDGYDDSVDCGVEDPLTHPGADDAWGDGIDRDCDGADGIDLDGDGFAANLDLPADVRDCDDGDPDVHPGADDPEGDGRDTDCSGDDPVDADGDGAFAGFDDCDDADPDVHQGATEVAGGADEDCDGVTDEGTTAYDDDGDGFCEGWARDGLPPECTDGSQPGDCNDAAPLLHSGDEDGDGESPCTGDCDDLDASRWPGAVESCDGVDNDCDGIPGPEELDGDGDGARACDGDCDDANDAVAPGASEICDATDADCDGSLVDGALDTDHDLLPDCVDLDDDDDGATDGSDCAPLEPLAFPAGPEACDAIDGDCDGDLVDGYPDTDADQSPDCLDNDDDGDGTLDGADCGPLDALTFPGAADPCDALDQDCDGSVASSWPDLDGDDLPDCADPDADGDLEPAPADCDDGNATVHHGAPEGCDGVDTDCDGVAGPGEADVDGDGAPLCAGDCDDGNPARFPGAVELCDGLDGDCDGGVPGDEADGDGDGARLCAPDCDEGNASVYPLAPELCDGLDNDCDTTVPTVEDDADGDGVRPCAGDCVDTAATVHPGAPELCDGWDNDCASGLGPAEDDADGDLSLTCELEAAGANPAYSSPDCAPLDPDTHPGAAEVCDQVDNDCDGLVPDDENDGDLDGAATCDGDCDDGLDTVWAGAAELCDGWDNDCDGALGPAEVDADGDGTTACVPELRQTNPQLRGGDCYDGDPLAFPGNWNEQDNDGIDLNCDGLDFFSLLGADTAIAGSVAGGHFGGHLHALPDGDGDGVAELAIQTQFSAQALSIFHSTSWVGTGFVPRSDAVFELTSSTFGDFVGSGAVDLGDLDGDGLTELAVGAYGTDFPTTNAGAITVLRGSTRALGGALPFAASDIRIDGFLSYGHLGFAMAPSGDRDGDGLLDLWAAAPGEGGNAGNVYWLSGANLAATTRGYAANLGPAWAGEAASDLAGSAIASGGDVNGDGRDDLLVGAPNHDAAGANAGAIYVVLGFSTPPTTATPLASSFAKILGVADGNNVGQDVVFAGDVDGDGLDDILASSSWQGTGTPRPGAVWVVLATDLGAGGTMSLSAAHTRIDGSTSLSNLGIHIRGLGDTDGDDLDDIALSVGMRGIAVFRASSLVAGVMGIGAADAYFEDTSAASGSSGQSLLGPGDIDGDGRADLVVGSPVADGMASTSGRVSVLISRW